MANSINIKESIWAKGSKTELKAGHVETVDGKIVLLDDCYNVRGSYFLKTDPKIAKDYFIPGEFVEKRNAHQFFIKLNKDSNIDPDSIAYSYSNLHIHNLTDVYSKEHGDIVWFLDSSILLEMGYIECLASGVFYPPYMKSKAKLTKTGHYRKVKATKRLISGDVTHNHKYGLASPTFSISEGKKYTMGLEIETCKGFIPKRLDQYLNYEAVHDGSLRDADGNTPGGEYVTGVLVGDMGFKQLKMLCNTLNKYCQIDKRCGDHVHLGGINFTKEFIVYMYYLARKLENEIFSMLPHSRRDNEYCRKLKKINYNLHLIDFKSSQEYHDYIDEIYNEILLYLSFQDRLDPTVVNKQNDHPLGVKCGYNHSTARYAWLNFIPAVFNTRGNSVQTIEIRNHHGSMNYMKIRNWTLIFMGMCYIVENHKEFIRNTKDITLADIIKISYPKKQEELIAYIEERKLKFKDKNDSIYQEENEYIEENKENNLNLKSL